MKKSKQNDFLTISAKSGINIKKICDIMYCMASSNYTKIFLYNNDCIVVSKSLKIIEEQINHTDFNYYRFRFS